MFTFKDFSVELNKNMLSCGLPVTLFHRKGMPISIKLVFNSGSLYDPIGKEGLAHFVEHMVLSGSENFGSKDKMAMYIENIGGDFGGVTSTDWFAINIEIATSGDLEPALFLLNEIINKATFAEEVIELERSSILKELGRKKSNPISYKWELYRDLFYQGTPKGRSTIGNTESINSINRSDLVNYYSSMLTSERGVLVISGDVETSTLINSLDAGLFVKKTGIQYQQDETPIIRKKRIAIQEYTDSDQTHLLFGFRTVPFLHEDLVPLNILATIYGGGRASVFQRRLRYEKGLVYEVGCQSYNSTNAGSWLVSTSTTNTSIQEVLDIIVEEITHIAKGEITNDALSFAINKEIKSIQRSLQTSQSWVNRHFLNELLDGKMRLPEYLNAISKVTLTDLARVGARYFISDSWYLVMCGKVKENEIIIEY